MTSTELSGEFGDEEEDATGEGLASRVHLKVELQSEERCDVQLDSALSAVIAHPEVSGVDWSATAA